MRYLHLPQKASRFGYLPGSFGLGYELDNFARLQSIVGKGIALEMLATARHFTAAEALAAGSSSIASFRRIVLNRQSARWSRRLPVMPP